MSRDAAGEEIERSVTIDPGQKAQRADKALAAELPEFSRSFLQKLFAAGRVWRDDQALAQSDKLRGGDTVSFSLPDPEPLDLTPSPVPLDAVWEDADLLVVNKPAGMVVHPGNGTGPDTLVHALLHHCKGQLSGIGGSERPGIVHRLDKETSGLIVVAKSDAAFRGLAEQFAAREVAKTYRALVAGVPAEKEMDIREPIGRHPVHRTRMTVRPDGRSAHSICHWQQTLAGGRIAKVDVRILTGRTHQIRVHLSHAGCPIAGDPLYGYRARSVDYAFPRVMLHAARIGFKHPLSGELLELEAPLPDDLAAAVNALGY